MRRLRPLDGGHSSRSVSPRSEEHTSELQSPCNLVCRLLLEKKKQSLLIVVGHAQSHGPCKRISVGHPYRVCRHYWPAGPLLRHSSCIAAYRGNPSTRSPRSA